MGSGDCPICYQPSEIDGLPGSPTYGWRCPRCGNYRLEDAAKPALYEIAKRIGPAISGWIRKLNAQGIVPSLGIADIERLKLMRVPPLRQRAETYLQAAVSLCPRLNSEFDPFAESLIGASSSFDRAEAKIIANYLVGEQLLSHSPGGQSWKVTARGRIEADGLADRRASSSQAFVALWFADEMLDVYRGAVEPAIRAAGYSPMMIGDKEHANRIDDEIISEIRRSAFLIADFTGHRGGVYFEAGFAMGLGLPVIWSCKKTAMPELHFDIRQYACIDWNDPEELRQRLQKRITALFGQGPVTAAGFE